MQIFRWRSRANSGGPLLASPLRCCLPLAAVLLTVAFPADGPYTRPHGQVVCSWLTGVRVVEQYADRTSDLRQRVLSYRAERPRDPSIAKAVKDALQFIDLTPATAVLPYVALADDGEVNFYWRRRESLLIDVGFVGDGMMHYYVWDEAGGVDVDASIPFSGRSLPPDIVRAMTRLPSRFGTDAHG